MSSLLYIGDRSLTNRANVTYMRNKSTQKELRVTLEKIMANKVLVGESEKIQVARLCYEWSGARLPHA